VTDEDALKLAVKICRARDEGSRDQIDWKIENDRWRDAAEFAAYSCQYDSLNLKPWEEPPCRADENSDDDSPARTLLRRMLAAGVSRYHPDPIAALDRKLTQ
jgi:hypothetical protein